MAEQVIVHTHSGTYPVVIGNGLDYGKLSLAVKKPCKAIIVSDDNVFPLYAAAAAGSFRSAGYEISTYMIPYGEASKSMDTVARLLDFLARENITRSGLLIALGGGVTGDITGFAAAVYLRGIDFIQLPTTILAAVDSSVGGKTGVDLPSGKNLAGAFHQPVAVLCDTNVFATLPRSVYCDGMAEVIKHGMIADREMLGSLKEMPADTMCARNVAIKARVVESDEFETGPRKLLNFGHTVGHAVEKLSNYTISHGRAVAIGMAVMTRSCVKNGLADPECITILTQALEQYDLSSKCDFSAKDLARAALQDKKRSESVITLVIPKKAGKAELYDLPVTELENLIAQGLEE